MDFNDKGSSKSFLNDIFFRLENFTLQIFRNFDLIVNAFFVVSFFLIFINILGLNLNSLFLLLPSLFVIYFIPGYQIFFKIFGSKYNFMEKLSLTILFSMIFDILVGIVAGYLGILITGLFYLIIILSTYYSLMLLNKILNKSKVIKKNNIRSIPGVIPKNFLLFIGFLILFALFAISRYPILFGSDPWFHLILTDEIIQTGIIPFDKYRGNNGLHLMGALIHLFSGYPTIQIARYFPIISFLNSGLIGFVVFRKIFKNDQIGILGSLLTIVGPYRYDFAQNQYFPTGLTLSIFLFMMFFYIERIEIDKWSIRENVFYFFLMGTSYFAIVFLSDISAIIFLFLFIFVSFLFLIKNRKIFVDFGFFIILLLLYGLYNIFGYESVIFESILVGLELPIYIFLILGIFGILFIFIINKFSVDPMDTFNSWLKKDPDSSFLKRVMKKYLKYILITFVLIFPFIISILFSLFFDISYGFIYMLTYMVIPLMLVIVSFIISIAGLIIFRKRQKTGPLIYFWAIYSFLILLSYSIYDLLFLKYWLWIRLLMYSGIGLICAQMAYLFYIYKDKFVSPRTFKRIYILILGCAILNNLFVNVNITQFKQKYEVEFAQWYGIHSTNQSSFLTGYRWTFILDYYSGTDQMIYHNHSYLLFPSNQINSNNSNLLWQFRQEVKKNNLYLLLDDHQIVEGIFGDVIGINFGKINTTILEEYYNLPYLDRIFTSRNAFNQSVQVYWLNVN